MGSIGLYIGRFQPFHNGHKYVLDTMLKENEVNIVCIGMSQGEIQEKKEEKNPFSFDERRGFIMDIYKTNKGISIYPIVDCENDKGWVEQILKIPLIAEGNTLKIYCGDEKNDSAIQTIKKHSALFSKRKLDIREISRKILPVSASDIRTNIRKGEIQTLQKKVPSQVLSQIVKPHLFP